MLIWSQVSYLYKSHCFNWHHLNVSFLDDEIGLEAGTNETEIMANFEQLAALNQEIMVSSAFGMDGRRKGGRSNANKEEDTAEQIKQRQHQQKQKKLLERVQHEFVKAQRRLEIKEAK